MKKFLSIMLSFIMILSLGIPAFAADSDNITSTENGSNTASKEVKINYTPSTVANPEAKWGESKEKLSEGGSGSLKEAFDAAKSDSSVKYVQIQRDLDLTEPTFISGGTFTLDLNGKVITANNYIFVITSENADVTFTDGATGGKLDSSGTGAAAVWVQDGKATFNSGTYKGDQTISTGSGSTTVINDGIYDVLNSSGRTVTNGGTLTINGGTFTGGWSSVCAGSSAVSTTVNGGTFTFDSYGRGDFEYYGGKLDFSGFTGTLAGITVYNRVADLEVGDSTIKLPTGYGLSTDDTNVVTTLSTSTRYTIISSGSTTPETKAVITGVSIEVDGTTYTTGTVTILPTSTVKFKVTGTDLDKGSKDNAVAWNYGSVTMENDSYSWTVNDEKTSATRNEMSATNFVNCTQACRIYYGNEGADFTKMTATDLYIIYQSKSTSVEITWGSMTFTYSDEQVSGADKGWTCEDGANKVTAKNTGTEKINAAVKYTAEADYSAITGTFDVSNKDLASNESQAFALTLSGKPEAALDNAKIGTVTVTIDKA